MPNKKLHPGFIHPAIIITIVLLIISLLGVALYLKTWGYKQSPQTKSLETSNSTATTSWKIINELEKEFASQTFKFEKSLTRDPEGVNQSWKKVWVNEDGSKTVLKGERAWIYSNNFKFPSDVNVQLNQQVDKNIGEYFKSNGLIINSTNSDRDKDSQTTAYTKSGVICVARTTAFAGYLANIFCGKEDTEQPEKQFQPFLFSKADNTVFVFTYSQPHIIDETHALLGMILYNPEEPTSYGGSFFLQKKNGSWQEVYQGGQSELPSCKPLKAVNFPIDDINCYEKQYGQPY